MTKYEFDNLLKPLVNIYDEIELDIIKDMLTRLLSYDDVQGTLKWYLEKLNDLKSFKKSNQKLFHNNKKHIEKVLKSIVENAGTKVDNFDRLEEYFNKGLIKKNPNSLYNSASINNLISEAFKDSKSIMDLINTTAIEGANKVYKNIINKAYIETGSGIYTYSESIRKALRNFAKEGIKTVNYVSGVSLTIESAIRRDVVTRVNKLVGDCEIEHAKELDTNLVYVDQHLGARIRTKYMKHDYEAHDEWQGKKYMIVGSNEEYPNLYEKTGYGEMLGLKGINCYHHMRPTWEWEKIPDRIDEIENKEKYELLQKQRAYERNIRSLKREKIVAKETDDKEYFSKVNKKIKSINEDFDKWLKNNKLTRDYNREYISNELIKPLKKDNWFNHLTFQEQRDLKEYISSGSYKINESLYNRRKLTEEQISFRDSLDNALSKVPKYQGEVNRSVNIESQEQLNSILSIFNNNERIGSWGAYISSSKKIYDEDMLLQFIIKSKNGRDLSTLNDEGGGEILFGRQTKFRYIDLSRKNGKIYIRLEEVE